VDSIEKTSTVKGACELGCSHDNTVRMGIEGGKIRAFHLPGAAHQLREGGDDGLHGGGLKAAITRLKQPLQEPSGRPALWGVRFSLRNHTSGFEQLRIDFSAIIFQTSSRKGRGYRRNLSA
jgi:hypothetical protein